MHKETFYLDGVDARSVGICLQHPIEFSEPVPIIKTEQIPGRNGHIIFDEGNYENRTAIAHCFSLDGKNVLPNIREINKFLFSGSRGYRRLETPDDPDYFWLARIENGARTEQRMRRLAPFDVAFDCKPQKFAKSGENTIVVKNGYILYNYYGFDALPIIRVRVKGEYGHSYGVIEENIKLTIADTTISFKPQWWSWQSLEESFSEYSCNLSEVLKNLSDMGITKKEFGISLDKCVTRSSETRLLTIDIEKFWDYLTDFAEEGTTEEKIISIFLDAGAATAKTVNLILGNTYNKEKTILFVLDSENSTVYNEMSSQDHNVCAPVFPVLRAGENVIKWDENITTVEIVPRWWCL